MLLGYSLRLWENVKAEACSWVSISNESPEFEVCVFIIFPFLFYLVA